MKKHPELDPLSIKRKFNLRSTHYEATVIRKRDQLDNQKTGYRSESPRIRLLKPPVDQTTRKYKRDKMEFFVNGHLSVYPGLSKELIRKLI